jgi:hypothetical protein
MAAFRLFRTQQWVRLRACVLGNSLDVVKVPLSFPLVRLRTMDNHKILLKFNLHKLYNL